jgi:hypothetical protein
MNHASAIPPVANLSAARRGWNVPVARISEADGLRTRDGEYLDRDVYPDPYADEPKWPAWKVTLAVVVFCAAFWSGIGYIATRLLG